MLRKLFKRLRGYIAEPCPTCGHPIPTKSEPNLKAIPVERNEANGAARLPQSKGSEPRRSKHARKPVSTKRGAKR